MASPIIKEEKIEIKQGMLKIASEDRSIFTLKRWKQRYFVFCHTRKGDNDWLKLFYYKSHSSYKEGNIPKDSIDITAAKEIGMMDRDLYGLDHIMFIVTPDKTHWLSASLCDERSQWLLALRAYKYNDVSKLPSSIERTYTWHGTGCNRSPPDKRQTSLTSTDPYAEHIASSHKLRKNYLICLKCRGIEVPKEVYEWVHPEDSDIYNRIYGTSSAPARKGENIYAVIPRLEDDNGGYSIVKNQTMGEQTSQKKTERCIPIEESSDDGVKGSCMPHFPSMDEYVNMAGRQDENENETEYAYFRKPFTRPPTKTMSVPCIFRAGHRSDSPHLKGSPEGILLENKRLSTYMAAVRNRYIPEPVLGGPINLRNGQRENEIAHTSLTGLIRNDPCQERISDDRVVDYSGGKGTSMSLKINEILKKKYGIVDAVFITDL